MREIKFYRSGDDHGWMSNFARFPIELDGKDWPTSEHYYQAMKFTDPQLQERVRLASGPGQAALIGRDKDLPLREDWDEVKDNVMRKVVLAKFRQHEELAYELVATGDAILIEHTKNDSYWADGGNGRGKNMLGVILMGVRDQLRTQHLSIPECGVEDDVFNSGPHPDTIPLEDRLPKSQRAAWRQRLESLRRGDHPER